MRSAIAWVVTFAVAYFGSRVVLAALGFGQCLFCGPFSWTRLFVRVGVFTAFWWLGTLAVAALRIRRRLQ